MKRAILVFTLLLALARVAYSQGGFAGTWTTTDFNNQHPIIEFRVDGTKLTGTISIAQGVFNVNEGTVNGDTVTFKATVFNGARINTFTGKIKGDTIEFTRSVKVRDEISNAATGIFGAKGPMQFTAKHDATASTPVAAFYGNWKLNPVKSKYVPGPSPKSVVPTVLEVKALGEGEAELLLVAADDEGIPAFNEARFKVDGKDYPLHTAFTVAGLLAGQKPTIPMSSWKSIDSRTVEFSTKNNNATTSVHSITVSSDGRTLTDSEKYFDAQGKQTTTSVEVYDRIP
jgi:hypothetical protein